MGAVKNAFHDEICNRCPECGVGLSEYDTLPCDSPVCPIPDAIADTHAKRGDAQQAPSLMSGGGDEVNRPKDTPQ